MNPFLSLNQFENKIVTFKLMAVLYNYNIKSLRLINCFLFIYVLNNHDH